MSEQEAVQTEEDKFFGVRTKIGGQQQEEPVEEAEVVEASDSEEGELTDDELPNYSKRVQKRINKLKYESHEEKRRTQSAMQERDEAFRVAQQIAEKNREYESLIGRGEQALINQVKERAALAVDQAKQQYKKAYEEGNTDNVVEAQEALTKATAELTEADRYAQNMSNQPAPQQENWQPPQPAQQPVRQPVQQPIQQAPKPDPETQAWAAKNPWFMQDGYEEMTSLAYGKHASLVKQGVQPNSSEYFRQIDETVRRAFPDHDWQDGNVTQARTSPVSQPSQVVAPTTRNNGAKPRTVRLSATQRSLAKRLGLTDEQYAKYV